MVQLDSEKLAKLKQMSQMQIGGFGPKIDVAQVAQNTKELGARMRKRQ